MLNKKKIVLVYPSMHAGGVPKRVVLFASILKESGHNVLIVCKKGSLLKKIEKNEIDYYLFPHNFQEKENIFKELFVYLKAFIKIFLKLKKEKPNLIVNHSRYTSVFVKILSKTLHLKYYSVAHGSYSGFSLLKKWVWGEKILAVSNTTKLNLINNYQLPPQKIQVIKNSIKPLKHPTEKEKNNFIEEFNLRNKTIISTITRFDTIKNVLMTIKSWELIYKKERNTVLLIIGHGPLEDEINKYIIKAGISERTLVINNIIDVSVVVSLSSFLILTSSREGLPSVVLEAFSLGKPVLATDVIGTNEIIKNNYNGLLVPLNDYKKLAELMENFIHDEILLNRLSKGAKDTYFKEFSFDKYRKQILNFFES
ncbi:MAG: glycosyltransferase [Bacteroidales bacterium]|jgi:glycosyltransferase involved in cell wall biosynthesis|nr:glycosyltransferase [Bacteroidales bacterium]